MSALGGNFCERTFKKWLLANFREDGTPKQANPDPANYNWNGWRERDREERYPVKLYDIVCENCKRPATIPFPPREGRGYKCKECFPKRREFYGERTNEQEKATETLLTL